MPWVCRQTQRQAVFMCPSDQSLFYRPVLILIPQRDFQTARSSESVGLSVIFLGVDVNLALPSGMSPAWRIG